MQNNLLKLYFIFNKKNNDFFLKFFKLNLIKLKVYFSFIKSLVLLNTDNLKSIIWLYSKFYLKNIFLIKFKLSLYMNASIKDRDKKLSNLHKKKKLKKKKIKYSAKNDLQIPWYFISLLSLSVGLIGDFFYNPLKIKQINSFILYKNNSSINFNFIFKIKQPVYIYYPKNLIYIHKLNYSLSNYLSIKYSLYKKLNFPYSIYYSHINHITKFEIFDFLSKFLGYFTKNGKKSYATSILKLFHNWSLSLNLNFYVILQFFLFNYIPFVNVKSMFLKKRKIIKPIMLSKNKGFFLALQWLSECAKVRKERTFARGLFLELLDIYNNQGLYIKKFNNLLLLTFNSRSSLSVRKRFFINYNLELDESKRKSLNEFIYNFDYTKNKLDKFKFINLLYKKKYLISNFYYNSIFKNIQKNNVN